MQKIPIFFSFDNNYVPQAAVTFESLLANAQQDIFYELYVLHTSVSAESQQKLYEQVSKHANAKLTYIDVTRHTGFSFSQEDFSTNHAGTTFTVETLYRCIPTLIPEFDQYDKIIYSDVDVVIVDNISEVFDIDLKEHYLASFKIPHFLSNQIEHLDAKFQGKYFGGGLWVMNLQQMRKDNLGEKIISIIKNPPCKLIWNDQDVMNLACDLNITYFSYRYVSIPTWLPLLEKRNFFDENYPNSELYDAMYRPKIVHYAGAKPWNDNTILKADLWYYWVSKTVFAEQFKADRPLLIKQQDAATYKAYLFGFIPCPFTKLKGTLGRTIKVKLFKFITLYKLIKKN